MDHTIHGTYETSLSPPTHPPIFRNTFSAVLNFPTYSFSSPRTYHTACPSAQSAQEFTIPPSLVLNLHCQNPHFFFLRPPFFGPSSHRLFHAQNHLFSHLITQHPISLSPPLISITRLSSSNISVQRALENRSAKNHQHCKDFNHSARHEKPIRPLTHDDQPQPNLKKTKK